MALITKPVSIMLTEIRDTLQDLQRARWSDQELYRYLDQGNRDIALTAKWNRITHIIDVGAKTSTGNPQTEYSLPYEAIEFEKITCKQSYTIVTPSLFHFPDNETEQVEIIYYGYAHSIVYGVTNEITLEQDLYDALRNYALYRAYAKEDSPENQQKSQMFKSEYYQSISRNAARWSSFGTPISRQDYYS